MDIFLWSMVTFFMSIPLGFVMTFLEHEHHTIYRIIYWSCVVTILLQVAITYKAIPASPYASGYQWSDLFPILTGIIGYVLGWKIYER